MIIYSTPLDLIKYIFNSGNAVFDVDIPNMLYSAVGIDKDKDRFSIESHKDFHSKETWRLVLFASGLAGPSFSANFAVIIVI